MLVTHVGHALDVRTGSPVGRGDQQHPFGLRIGFKGSAYVVGLWRVGQLALGIELGVDPHRVGAIDDHPRDHRLVGVVGDQQLFTWPGHRQHRSLHRQRAPTGGEECLLGAHGVGHQLLSVGKDTLGLPPVVEAVKRQNVGGEDPFAHDGKHTRVDSAALTVPRGPEGDVAASAELGHRLQNRCSRVVHGYLRPTMGLGRRRTLRVQG
jgi:hypothetical protein